jgi:hypothetical protein
VGDSRGLSLEEDTDYVEAYGFEGVVLGGQVSFGEGADGPLLARGDRVERVPVSRSTAQLHLDEDEGALVAQDQVQLSEAGAVVALDELVALLGQVTKREVFAPGPNGASAQGPTPA